MQSIRTILASKSPEVWSVSVENSVYDALRLMAEKDIGAVLVLDGDQVVGIFSERDYARKVIDLHRSARNIPVADLMTRDVLYVRPQQSPEECMALMTQKRIRHLPVMEDNRLVGIITIGDLVKAIIDDQQFMIAELEQYISGAVR